MKQQSPLWTEFLEYIEDNSSETKKILEGSSQRDDEETKQIKDFVEEYNRRDKK